MNHNQTVGNGGECARVFRKTRTAETRPGMEKLTADATVHAHSSGDVVNIAADPFTKVGDFVDEGNLGREKGIGCVLGEFGGFERSDHKWSFNQVKRPIKVAHDRNRFFVRTSNHHTIGSHEIVDGRALAQELGIGNYTKS